MARPLSETKRDAILNAATELVAVMGTSAPTARIAKAAGVSEGTLFTYFASKEDLLNKLFLEIEAAMAAALTEGYPETEIPRERCRHLWDRLIDWGRAHPVQHRAIRQLKVSDRIDADSRQCADGFFRDVRRRLERDLAGHAAEGHSMTYLGAMLDALAEATLEFIARDPARYETYRQSGFDLFWNGIAR